MKEALKVFKVQQVKMGQLVLKVTLAPKAPKVTLEPLVLKGLKEIRGIVVQTSITLLMKLNLNKILCIGLIYIQLLTRQGWANM